MSDASALESWSKNIRSESRLEFSFPGSLTDVVTRYLDRTFSARAAHSSSVPTKAIESTSVDIAEVTRPSGVG